MDRNQFLDTLLSQQETRNQRARRLARIADRAEELARRRDRQRALLQFGWAPGAIERFLNDSSRLTTASFRYCDKARRFYDLAAEALTRNR